MYYYKMFDMSIKSNICIKQLIEIDACSECDVEFIFGEYPQEIYDLFKGTRQEEIGLFVSEEYMWMTNKFGYFAVIPDGRIYAKAKGDTSDLILIQFVLGYCISIFTHYHDMLPMHCGAVAINGKGVVITGESGSGKSTLTFDFIDEGELMISDDIAAIRINNNKAELLYGFPQQKLCRDTALERGYNIDELDCVDPVKDKYAVKRHDQFLAEPIDLGGIFVIQRYNPDEDEFKEYNGELIIEEKTGFSKVEYITCSLFTAGILNQMGLKTNLFHMIVKMAEYIPVYVIYRPVGKDTVEDIKAIIRKKMGC